jgi:DNA-binding response OmpR family regulator
MPSVNEPAVPYRPCLVLAHSDAVYAADVCRRLRRQGWDVYQTHGGPEARRLARMMEPELVVLDVDLEGETGWLTCAKLMQERPDGKVLLVCERPDGHDRHMAEFVGAAALLSRQDCLVSHVSATLPTPMPAA